MPHDAAQPLRQVNHNILVAVGIDSWGDKLLSSLRFPWKSERGRLPQGPLEEFRMRRVNSSQGPARRGDMVPNGVRATAGSFGDWII